MWTIRMLAAKRNRLFIPACLAIFLLLRQEAMALIKPWPFASRRSSQQARLARTVLQEGSKGAKGDTGDAYEDKILSQLDETKLVVRDQQEKIDMLMKLLLSKEKASQQDARENNKQQQSSLGTSQNHQESYGSQPIIPSLKAMLFIDGTWLYYSMNERDMSICPLQQRYGKGWQYRYDIDWGSLPGIICQALQEQETVRGWAAHSTRTNGQYIPRPIEITRVSVFTSYKADTAKTSLRYQMFQNMLEAKFDVHMMETVGRGEKCVDIQLAVDMLHYATVPEAYDVALLLTGDKDFMPAMGRCRQKGRRVGLVSMRGACNRALYETPNLKDFDVIWLEDYLDDLIQQNSRTTYKKRKANISELTLINIIKDFISLSGMPRVSSRDVGKYIKTLYVGDRNVLDEVKQTYGGLYQFLIVSECFLAENSPGDKAFWVAIREYVDTKLSNLAEVTTFNSDEKEFFERYDLSILEDREVYYHHSMVDGDLAWSENDNSSPPINWGVETRPPTIDYSGLTVARLKEICRERKLAVSGRKADLIERITEDDMKKHEVMTQTPEGVPAAAHLEGLISEYLQVKGGQASSRDVGRYLQANKASEKRRVGESDHVAALAELKELYGSIRRFVMSSDLFEVDVADHDNAEAYEFIVRFADDNQ